VLGVDSVTLSSFDNGFATLSFEVQKHVQAGLLSHTRQKYSEFITTISKHNYRAHRFIRHNGDEVIRFCCDEPPSSDCLSDSYPMHHCTLGGIASTYRQQCGRRATETRLPASSPYAVVKPIHKWFLRPRHRHLFRSCCIKPPCKHLNIVSALESSCRNRLLLLTTGLYTPSFRVDFK
jgi:hypothetical protein